MKININSHNNNDDDIDNNDSSNDIIIIMSNDDDDDDNNNNNDNNNYNNCNNNGFMNDCQTNAVSQKGPENLRTSGITPTSVHLQWSLTDGDFQNVVFHLSYQPITNGSKVDDVTKRETQQTQVSMFCKSNRQYLQIFVMMMMMMMMMTITTTMVVMMLMMIILIMV